MLEDKQINKWLNSGLINKKQATQMLADITQAKKESKSDKFITAISTIGAILLGVGAILFIASNWDQITDLTKVIILAGSTFGAYFLGYYFKYQKQSLPKVGTALLFLGALLFGASTILIAQIYNINANAHSLVLIWLIGILPLVYAFESQPIAALSALLFLLWIALFIFREGDFGDEIMPTFPVIYISAGTLLFSLGCLHYFKPNFHKIARIFRIIGIKAAIASLFLLTFEVFSNYTNSYWYSTTTLTTNLPSQITTGIVIFSILSILGLTTNLFFNPSKSKINTAETAPALAILAFTLIFFFFPSTTAIYTLVYNLIFAALTLFLIYIGYHRADIKLVDIGMFWLGVFIIAKYFDFFWDLLDRSIFFLLGGLILVLGGIALERKRKEIKKELTH